MIRACIFDLGGTIVDKYSLTPFLSLKKAFLKFNLPVDDNLIYKDMGFDKTEHIHKILFNYDISKSFMERYGNYPTTEDTYKISKEYYKIQMKESKNINIIPETKKIINYLMNKNILIGVTTGFNKETTEIIINKLEKNDMKIDKYVSSSCLAEPSRPYPHMINHILKDFKINDPKNVIKVDDTLIGIQEGKEANTWTAGVARWSINMKMNSLEEAENLNCLEMKKKLIESRKILEKSDSNYILNTLDDLPEIINQINT